MKKRRLAAILCGVCLALLAASCAPDQSAPPGPKTVEGKIVFLSGTTICVAEDGEHAREDGLYSVSTEGAEIWGNTEDGILKPGMRVALSYDGTVQETYPLSLTPTNVFVLEQGDDFVGMYMEVMEHLVSRRSNRTPLFAFDLTGLPNLTEAEKQGLVWLFGSDFQRETFQSTRPELIENGFIDPEDTYFKDGGLVTLKAEETSEGVYEIEASLWYSVQGATGFSITASPDKNGVLKVGDPHNCWQS